MQQPLAIRLRPTKLDEVFGQQHLTGENMLLRRCVSQQHLFSMIFYGPPGFGKTTLALALASELNLPYRSISAVTGNKKDLVEIFEQAKLSNGLIVIIDEIHRLNKDKQDLLLPHIETGLITVIGATTSNPYFAINPAVRSRCHLLEVKSLTVDDAEKAIDFALTSEKGYKGTISIDADAKRLIAYHCNGDLRYAYNLIEICAMGCFNNHIDVELVKKYSSMANMHYDHDEDGHYDAVSAFQKSIRGSDVNAALFYLSRLAMANDLDSIERRLLVIAYEDVGLANPAACARTVNALDAARRIGFPEALIPLGVSVIELALSPKSRSAVDSVHNAYRVAEKSPYAVPVYLRLNPVGLADEDKYDYSGYHKFSRIQYLPDELKDMEFFVPNNNISNPYEESLVKNYFKLKQYYRTNKLKTLK